MLEDPPGQRIGLRVIPQRGEKPFKQERFILMVLQIQLHQELLDMMLDYLLVQAY